MPQFESRILKAIDAAIFDLANVVSAVQDAVDAMKNTVSDVPTQLDGAVSNMQTAVDGIPTQMDTKISPLETAVGNVQTTANEIKTSVTNANNAIANVNTAVGNAESSIKNDMFTWEGKIPQVYQGASSGSADETVCSITGKGYMTGIMVSGTNTATSVESVRISIIADGVTLCSNTMVVKGWGDASVAGAGMGAIIPFATSLVVKFDTSADDCSGVVTVAVALD